MQTTVTSAAMTRCKKANAEPITFLKRFGSTNFVVSVHFSRTNKETMGDKVFHLIEKEVANL